MVTGRHYHFNAIGNQLINHLMGIVFNRIMNGDIGQYLLLIGQETDHITTLAFSIQLHLSMCRQLQTQLINQLLTAHIQGLTLNLPFHPKTGDIFKITDFQQLFMRNQLG